MSNLLTVQDPDENASEVATATRAKLQEWADKHLPANQAETVQALTDERIKELRVVGSSGLAIAKGTLESPARTTWKPKNQFAALLVQLTSALRSAEGCFNIQARPREFSHAFEGAVREFHKQFFQGGMQWNLHAEYLAVLAMRAPTASSGYQDRVWYNQVGTESPFYVNSAIARPQEENWYPNNNKVQQFFKEKFESVQEWAMSEAGVTDWSEHQRYLNRMAVFGNSGCVVHYIDADGPWVAGFLTNEDECRFRFRRVRLGAYLAEHGMADADVRKRVERAKQLVAGANFVAYPNDLQWEDQYTSGPHSCMADSADNYECWDNLHPTAAYASSYHGCGDNGLVLLTSVDEDGTITGRGILNVNRGSIVRWYGDAVAERVLMRSDVEVHDGDTFKESWLAFLSNGSRFIHPYVDGNNNYGDIRNGRVYIVRDSNICISDTQGSSMSCETQHCVDDGEYHPVDECYYQECTGTYTYNDPDTLDWQCPVVGEYAPYGDRTSMNLHGIDVEVSDHVYYNRRQYLTEAGTRVWTIDDDERREAFLEQHGLDEDLDDEEDEDEEAA